MLGKPQSGFTLIEIMVVLMILGVIMTIAVISFGDFGTKKNVLAEGNRLIQAINLAKQEAILDNTTLALRVHKNGYDFFKFSAQNHWIAMPSPLFHRHFPPNILLNQHGPKSTQILIDASGTIRPFEFALGTEEQPNIISLSGQRQGSILVHHRE